jgi:phage gp46-like protein
MDFKTVFMGFDKGADWAIGTLGLEEDDGLETAVILSLFTDRRAEPDDVLPFGETDRRGHWSDAYPAVPGDRMGSRLWLLSREKQLPQVVVKAREYLREALEWMEEDGVASRVDCDAFILRDGVLGMKVAIYRPDGSRADFSFDYLWRTL